MQMEISVLLMNLAVVSVVCTVLENLVSDTVMKGYVKYSISLFAMVSYATPLFDLISKIK